MPGSIINMRTGQINFMRRNMLYMLLLFAFSCTSRSEPPEAAAPELGENIVILTPEQILSAGIQTGSPRQQMMQATLRVSGTVEAPPQNKVTVSFPLGGYIAGTHLIPGMQVRKGQVLATLQDPALVQLQQDYLTARSRLMFLEKEYERQRVLNTTKTTSDKLFEQTASEYRTERINAQALKEKLLLIGINAARLTEGSISRTVNLYAPIGGFVTAVNVNRGKYVSPTDVLFEIVNPADLHLTLSVFERDLQAIQPGQNITAHLTSDTAKVYSAQVHYVSRSLDESRSALVHCDFTGAVGKLSPGMFMNAVVDLNNRLATVVPEEAVVRFGAEEYIFVQQASGGFEMTPVQTGVRKEGWVELTSTNPSLLQQTIIVKNAYAALMKLHNKSEE